MIRVHELETELGLAGGITGDWSEVGEEGDSEGCGVDPEFPACWVAGDYGMRGRDEERVGKELVAEAGAEYLNLGVGVVEVWRMLVVSRGEGEGRCAFDIGG